MTKFKRGFILVFALVVAMLFCVFSQNIPNVFASNDGTMEVSTVDELLSAVEDTEVS